MTQSLIRPAATPPPLFDSKFAYGHRKPPMRAAELPEICSVRVQDLFEELPDPIHTAGQDTAVVRAATHDALAGVDMSVIQPGDSVHILCSEHGFGMMGGDAYAEIIKTVRDEVLERAGAARVKLALSSAGSKFEQFEIVSRWGLDDYFQGRVFAFGPYDNGVAIDTDIGRLYGVQKAFAAKRLIHIHYDDPREMHFHRFNGRLLKSFTMSYARRETRSIFHNNFPTRSANIVPRAIYESPFIRNKWVFAAVLSTSPTGTVGVDADNDLIAMDRRMSRDALLRYGKLVELFHSIDECFQIADDTRWLPYQHAGGLTACTLWEADQDHLDLDLAETPSPDVHNKALVKGPVKAVVYNYAWKLGAAAADISVAANPGVGKDLRRVHPDQNVFVAENLPAAMEIAAERSGTDKAIVFDGCYGAINVTRSLAEELISKAPAVARRVEDELLPKWLAQRNLAQVSTVY